MAIFRVERLASVLIRNSCQNTNRAHICNHKFDGEGGYSIGTGVCRQRGGGGKVSANIIGSRGEALLCITSDRWWQVPAACPPPLSPAPPHPGGGGTFLCNCKARVRKKPEGWREQEVEPTTHACMKGGGIKLFTKLAQEFTKFHVQYLLYVHKHVFIAKSTKAIQIL
jgi:hypothetical protein